MPLAGCCALPLVHLLLEPQDENQAPGDELLDLVEKRRRRIGHRRCLRASRRPLPDILTLFPYDPTPEGQGAWRHALPGWTVQLTTVPLRPVARGEQAAQSSRIENYLGFPAGISGAETSIYISPRCCPPPGTLLWIAGRPRMGACDLSRCCPPRCSRSTPR